MPIRSSYAQTIGQDRLPGWGQSIKIEKLSRNGGSRSGRVGVRLRGIAYDVRSYATVGRGAERARHGLQNADEEFERAAQHHKALKLKRSQW